MGIIKTLKMVMVGLLVTGVPAAHASETIKYTYDAKGRLVRVQHTGTVNNNVAATYTFDKVDNRKVVTVTGAP